MVALQKVTDSLEEVYKSNAAWPSDIDHALVLHCSDPWYREATTEFLVYLGFSHSDLFAVPGGPASVLQSSLTFTADRSRVKLLMERHEVTRFVGVVHLNCSYYKIRYRALSDEGRVEKQVSDLREFKRYIRSIAPEGEIKLFFAEQADGHIRFLIVR